MAVVVRCPNPECAASCSVADDHAGRPVRCPRCGKSFLTKPPSPASPDEPGSIGRYHIRARLGAGAFGTVYRAHDPQLDREVALKLLRRKALGSPKAVERFRREAQAAARLMHPNVVPVHDAGQHDGTFYIASAFIAGRTLADLIPEGGMDSRRAVALVVQLADALAYAHERKVLHRDVKPANALVDDRDHLYLTDFGLAGWIGGPQESRLTQLGTVMGTPAYVAPEQAAGDVARVGPPADVYSAGVVLYELLTGQTPFTGPTQVVLYNAVKTQPPRPSSLRRGLDPRLEAICLRAMDKDPQKRPDAVELAAELRRWLGDASTVERPATLTPRKPAKQRTLGPGRAARETAPMPDSVVETMAATAARERPLVSPPVRARRQRGWGGAAALLLACVIVLAGVAALLFHLVSTAKPSDGRQEDAHAKTRPIPQEDVNGQEDAKARKDANDQKDADGQKDNKGQKDTNPPPPSPPPDVASLRQAAERGDADACFALAGCYAKGKGTPRSPLAARFWYEKARDRGHAAAAEALAELEGLKDTPVAAERLHRGDAEKGKAQAQHALAVAYLHQKDGVTARHDAEALTWAQKSADQEYGPALALLALMHHNGDGAPQDSAKAKGLFERAIKKGETWCNRNLGQLHQTGDGTPVSLAEGARCYRLAAEAGDLEGQFRWGNCLADGMGIESDADEALRWWKKAAASGHAEAKATLAAVAANDGKIPPEAERRYRADAEAGKAAAQHQLGWAYGSGTQGVIKDTARAKALFQRAAAQGYAPSEEILGWYCANAIEGPRDPEKAVEWYRKAAARGNVPAARNVAYHYLNGDGVKADVTEAARYFLQAARGGDVGSMFHIGNCYADGRGVPRDRDEAIRWWRKAAERGDPLAKKSLEAIEK